MRLQGVQEAVGHKALVFQGLSQRACALGDGCRLHIALRTPHGAGSR